MMEESISKTYFITVVIICFLLVTFVYVYNEYPFMNSTFIRKSNITPQQLCQLLYEDRSKPPEAFTYDRQSDGKYVIYKLDYSDGSYRRLIKDFPVDVDGFEWLSKNKGELNIEFTKTGFKVAELGIELNCPPRWSWSLEKDRCVEDPLCSEYNNSIIPLLNVHYNEIENPATTIHTPLTNNKIHQRLYIECSKAEKKPIIKSCSENTFVKMSLEPFDESKLSPILPLENGEANVNAICKRFDVCENREDNSVHRFLINDESDKPLKQDEYYICKNNKSEKRKCAPNHKVNPDMEHAASLICIPLNHCDTGHDFYFRINNDAYGYCRKHVEYMESCDGNGIFHMPDKSIQCRNKKCLEPNEVLIYNDHIFNYPYGIESCFDGNSPKKISCDEMFKELQPVSNISNISLPRTKINRPSELSSYLKEYLEDHEIVLPTKFYYDRNTEKCEPFKPNNIKQFLINMKMIKDDAIIYKSTSYGMRSLPFRLKDDEMMLNPKDLGFGDAKQVYAIFNGKIYCTGVSNIGIIWNENSKNFYSFISPIEVEPKPIDNTKILDYVYDEIDGVYYGLCIKYEKKLIIMDSEKNRVDVLRRSLTEFESATTHEIISSKLIEKYQIDYTNLISKEILSKNFPKDQFSWNNLFVGKYFYDKEKNHFVIWHDHLFVISVLNHNLIVDKTVDSNGQCIVDNFPSGIISRVYHDRNEKIRTWNETALVTTFNYFGDYFDSPAPFWLSFINIPVKELTENNVLDYLRIDYPMLQKNISRTVLMRIIKMKYLELNIGDLEAHSLTKH